MRTRAPSVREVSYLCGNKEVRNELDLLDYTEYHSLCLT